MKTANDRVWCRIAKPLIYLLGTFTIANCTKALVNTILTATVPVVFLSTLAPTYTTLLSYLFCLCIGVGGDRRYNILLTEAALHMRKRVCVAYGGVLGPVAVAEAALPNFVLPLYGWRCSLTATDV